MLKDLCENTIDVACDILEEVIAEYEQKST